VRCRAGGDGREWSALLLLTWRAPSELLAHPDSWPIWQTERTSEEVVENRRRAWRGRCGGIWGGVWQVRTAGRGRGRVRSRCRRLGTGKSRGAPQALEDREMLHHSLYIWYSSTKLFQYGAESSIAQSGVPSSLGSTDASLVPVHLKLQDGLGQMTLTALAATRSPAGIERAEISNECLQAQKRGRRLWRF
jgi:hypothetical protein